MPILEVKVRSMFFTSFAFLCSGPSLLFVLLAWLSSMFVGRLTGSVLLEELHFLFSVWFGVLGFLGVGWCGSFVRQIGQTLSIWLRIRYRGSFFFRLALGCLAFLA